MTDDLYTSEQSVSAVRAPWWMYVVAASFLAYFLLLVYSDFLGPQMTGMMTEFNNEHKTVRMVLPDSPAARAGLETGDRVVSADGRIIKSLSDWTIVRVNLEAGRPVPLVIERDGRQFETEMVLMRSSYSDWTSREGIVLLKVRLANLITLILAIVIAFSRPNKLINRVGGWFLATVATMSFLLPYGMAATWRELPPLLGALLWIPLFSTTVFAPLLFTFFAIFPRRLFHSRLVWLLVWLPVALSLPSRAEYYYLMIYRPELVPTEMDWFLSATNYLPPLYVVAGLAALIVNYRRLEDAGEKRRVRVLVAGSVVGWLGALVLMSYYWGPASRFVAGFYSSPAFILPVVLFLLFPISFAYVVVKHRVMEIPVLLKRSARYLLVQRGFVVFIFLLSVGVTFVFINLYSRFVRPNSESALPAGIAVGVGFGMLLAWVGAQAERRVTERIDRAFFRSAYDARQILEDLAAKARTTVDRAELASLLARHLNEALHPDSIAIYLESANGVLTVAGGQQARGPETVSPRLAVLARLAERGEPWDVPGESEGREQLSELRPMEAECLVPVMGREGRLVGLIALGARMSEEPYSGEDKRLLASVAGQVGIAIESIRLAEQMADRIEAERRASREMEIARQVQTKLFPQRMPPLETLEYVGGCIQARAVGGDYYDFLDLGPGRLAFVLADISGKGISAALLMANLQANLRSQYTLAGDDLSKLLCAVNRLFYESTAPEHFATLFFATYEDETRTLRYVNCGHNPPLLVRASGEVHRLEATAMVLGLFDRWDCETGEVSLEPGDTLVAFSDGVTEATSDDGEEYGEARLIEVLRSKRCQAVASLHEDLVAEVTHFSGHEQEDDITVVAVRSR
jgi:sigma-B regulation protein RsbU (phosphoserine phosphatase)